MKKCIFVLTIFLFVLASSSIVVFASDESLTRLRELLQTEPEDIVAILDSHRNAGDLSYIPNVILIAAPEYNREYFLIGIDREPTLEDINFILAFTEIPEEHAFITHVEFIMEHQHYSEGSYDYYSLYDIDIEPFSTGGYLRMGNLAYIPGIGGFTIGHPNSTGTSFFTALHGRAHVGSRVYLGRRTGNSVVSTGVRIGTVTRTAFGDIWANGRAEGRDFAEVRVSDFGHEVSRRVSDTINANY